MKNPIPASSLPLSSHSPFLSILFYLSPVLPYSSHSCLSFSCSTATDNTDYCARALILPSHPCLLPTDSTIYDELPPLRTPAVRTKLNKQIHTLIFFVDHLLPFNVRVDSGFCFFLGVEADIAGGVVNPLDSEVRVGMEIVSYFFVLHVIDSKQIPSVITNNGCV